MNIQVWLIRAKRWARKPPSEGRVKLVLGVVAICLVIIGIEWAFGWPDWLTVNRISANP
jgi:predicted acyltransferase